jgi:hypothetical protein
LRKEKNAKQELSFSLTAAHAAGQSPKGSKAGKGVIFWDVEDILKMETIFF